MHIYGLGNKYKLKKLPWISEAGWETDYTDDIMNQTSTQRELWFMSETKSWCRVQELEVVGLGPGPDGWTHRQLSRPYQQLGAELKLQGQSQSSLFIGHSTYKVSVDRFLWDQLIALLGVYYFMGSKWESYSCSLAYNDQ